MKLPKLLLGTVAATLLAISPDVAEATELDLFCTNLSNPALNPEGDGVSVQVIFTNKIQKFDAVHKVSGKLYDRAAQYKLLHLTQTPDGNPSYYWEGEMLKDPNVVMTGHLWQNAGVWLYDEHQSYKDRRPVFLATPPVMCLAPNSNAPPRVAEATPPEPSRAPSIGKEPPASATNALSCSDPKILESALNVYLNSTMGHIDKSLFELMRLDHVTGMGISNNENSKKCRAQYTCDMNHAKEIESGLYGPHPLTQYCFTVN
jgi:hypothetical protein